MCRPYQRSRWDDEVPGSGTDHTPGAAEAPPIVLLQVAVSALMTAREGGAI